MGLVFSRRNKNTSDYFRGGGIMPWWDGGRVGLDGEFQRVDIYRSNGQDLSKRPVCLLTLLYYSSIAAYAIILAFTCYRFRRMRTVTPMEAIRARFGAPTQQFMTWIRLPFLIFFGGVGLRHRQLLTNVFISGAFGVE